MANFSGRQLLGVAGLLVLAALLVPGSTYAATEIVKSVTIQDAASGQAATVDASGSLRTNVAAPKNYYANYVETDLNGTFQLAAPPAGKALIVTSLHVSIWAVPIAGNPFARFAVRVGSCSGATVLWLDEALSPGNPVLDVFPYSPGAVVPSGDVVCVDTYGGFAAATTVVGYAVSPTALGG